MFKAFRSDELPPGEGAATQIRRVRIREGHMMVARLADGGLVAFGPTCPHQLTPLDDATIHEGVTGLPSSLGQSSECSTDRPSGPVVRCPRHGYQYDAVTGANVQPTRDANPKNLWKLKPKYLPVFDVVERDGWVWVAEVEQPPPESWDPSLEARPVSATDDAAAASTAPPPIPVSPPAGVEQSMKFLTTTAGEVLEIRVPATPIEGYQWRTELIGDLLEIVEDQFEGGEMPCQRVRVMAHGAGAATLTCTYASADGRASAIRTYIVRVAPKA